MRAAHVDVIVGMQVEIDAAGQGHVALAPAQVFAGLVNGGQGRRAHGIDGARWALQVKTKGNAIGDTGKGSEWTNGSQLLPARTPCSA